MSRHSVRCSGCSMLPARHGSLCQICEMDRLRNALASVKVERDGLLAAVLEAVAAQDGLEYVETRIHLPSEIEMAKARKQVSDLELRSLARNLKAEEVSK